MQTANVSRRAPINAIRYPMAAVLALAAGEILAQGAPLRFELTPYAGYRFGGTFEDAEDVTQVELDDDAAFGLIFNVRESASTQWEVVYARQDTAADTAGLSGLAASTDVRLQHLQGGGTYEFESRGAVRPYLAATLGGTQISPRVSGLDSDTFWSFSIGTGLQIRPTQRLGIRLEARAWGTLIESGSSLFCVSGIGGAACAIQIDGKLLWQVETFAGITVRF